jgi:predicted Rossmann fold flavoprotein
METDFKKDFDTIVIGGGASGMMAAISASEADQKVLIIEKNEVLGKKLSITGGGRCNILNLELDIHKLLKNYGNKKSDYDFLYSPFSIFGVKETIEFFKNIGIEIFEEIKKDNNGKIIENRKRAFPVSQSAINVRDKMLNKILKNKVEILYNTKIEEIIFNNSKIEGIVLPPPSGAGRTNEIYTAKKYILATGGYGKPETGSTGDGFNFIKKINKNNTKKDWNIKINESTPDLLPVISKDRFIKELSGMSIENIKITFFVDDVKKKVLKYNKNNLESQNRILFTHFGLSGPTIINNSRFIKEYLKEGNVYIEIDLFPKFNEKELDLFLLNIFEKNKNKKLKNVLKEIYDGNILENIFYGFVFAPPSGVGGTVFLERQINSISKYERKNIINLFKKIKININAMASDEKAIVSDGGIDLKEIDFKNMSLKKIPNLFVTGDLLDISRPSGGFSLQLC